MTKEGEALARRNGILFPAFPYAWDRLAEQEALTESIFASLPTESRWGRIRRFFGFTNADREREAM